MTDPELSTLMRAAQGRCVSGAGGCPDADDIAALAAGTLDPLRRDAVLDRVTACAMCSDALKFALDAQGFAEELARDVLAAPQPAAARPRVRRAWPSVALAASLMVAVGTATLMLRAPPPEVLRGSAMAAVEPLDGARLATAPARMAWACNGPAMVTVEVLDATGLQAWSGTSDDCAIELPAQARTRIGAGEWLWQVRAPDGTPVAGPWRFRVD